MLFGLLGVDVVQHAIGPKQLADLHAAKGVSMTIKSIGIRLVVLAFLGTESHAFEHHRFIDLCLTDARVNCLICFPGVSAGKLSNVDKC